MVNEIHTAYSCLFKIKMELYIYIYIYIYIYNSFLPMTIDEISSVHGNFSNNEKCWAVSKIDAGCNSSGFF